MFQFTCARDLRGNVYICIYVYIYIYIYILDCYENNENMRELKAIWRIKEWLKLIGGPLRSPIVTWPGASLSARTHITTAMWGHVADSTSVSVTKVRSTSVSLTEVLNSTSVTLTEVLSCVAVSVSGGRIAHRQRPRRRNAPCAWSVTRLKRGHWP